jgi:chromosome partitioning protein
MDVCMRIFAIENQKGGSGKTTLAIHLAQAFAANRYNTVILDLDPQASSAEWKDARKSETPAVIAIPSSRLQRVIEQAEEMGTDVLIIDTAPHSESIALAAARVSNLILIPCQPSIMDLRALRKTAELIGHLKKLAYVVLNSVPPHKGVSNDAAAAITEQFGLPVADIRLGARVAYSRCLIDGNTAAEYEPDGKAAREVQKLHKWVCHLVDMPTQKKAA